MQVQLKVNGKAASVDVAPNTLLVRRCANTCGSPAPTSAATPRSAAPAPCIVNGRAIKSCNTLAAQHPGAEITTIEGLAAADGTHAPDAGGLQGMPRPAMRLLHARHGDERAGPVQAPPRTPAKREIREQLEGNMCRCTGYQNIVKAVQQGQAAMAAKA